jgi:hypothetical protein
MVGTMKVTALIEGHISIDGTWTEADFLELAIAALDQAGVSAKLQQRVHQLALDEVGELDVCADCEGSTAEGSPVPHVYDDAITVARRRVIAVHQDTHGTLPPNGFDIDAAARALLAQERAS